MSQAERRWIDCVWRVALVLVFCTQIVLLALRTRAGSRAIPAALVRVGFLRPKQVGFLRKTMAPPGDDPVPALAAEIRQIAPANDSLEIVWSGPALQVEAAELGYALYPRRFTQRGGFAGDRSEDDCRVDWHTETELTLSCPGASWTYPGKGVAP